MLYYYIRLYLVGGVNPSEKYESQLGLLFPIYGKIIQMLQTTNHIYLYSVVFFPLCFPILLKATSDDTDSATIYPNWRTHIF